VKEIIRIIKDGGKKKDLQQVVEFAHRFGGIDYTIKKAEQYSASALEAIQMLPSSSAKDSLTQFVEFVMERSK
jgi:octaprenyl-diphosphate synthase